MESHDGQLHQLEPPPPSYDSCIAASASASASGGTLQEPILLVLSGQAILGGSAAAPPLYEMNRGVANLGHATSCVELTRVERTIHDGGDNGGSSSSSSMPVTCTDAKQAVDVKEEEEGSPGVDNDGEEEDGEREKLLLSEEEEGEKTLPMTTSAPAPAPSPRIKVRRRHIMDLVHPTNKGGTATGLAETASGAPAYYAKPRTRTTHGGAWGLRKTPMRSRRWQVLPVLDTAPRHGEARYEDKGKPLFRVAAASGGGKGSGAYEWTDADGGETLAVEEEDEEGRGQEDGGRKKEYRLRTTRPMERNVLDALVAMWCCRIWEESAASQPDVYEGMDKVRRRLRFVKHLPVSRTSTMGISLGAAF
ncbi:hypothetical protein V2A60_009920 [Cordyceps javanica]